VYHEALEHENEENGSVWDCTMIATMKAHEDMIVNPIYEWSDTDVWEYLKENNYKYNPMYDMGYTRCGCIGCPLATYKIKMKGFSDFPYAKELYIKAFDEMLKKRKAKGKDEGSWTSGQAVFDWWVEEWKRNCKGQISIEEYMNDIGDSV